MKTSSMLGDKPEFKPSALWVRVRQKQRQNSLNRASGRLPPFNRAVHQARTGI